MENIELIVGGVVVTGSVATMVILWWGRCHEF